MPVKCIGAANMKQRLKDLSRRERQAALNGVEEFEQIELGEMEKLVPVDTGELLQSGYYEKPYYEGDRIRGAIGFDAPHAFIVHEDLEAFHRVGEAKFVETPLNASEPHFGERVAESIRKELNL